MAKGERKAAGAMAQQQYGQEQQAQQAYTTQAESERQTALGQGAALYPELTAGYGAGGTLASMEATGGYDPTQLAGLRSNLANVGGGYGQMATGWTDPEKAAFRRRATRGVRDVYDVLGTEANRRRSMTGGGGGEISQMARQVSQKESEAATGAEVSIAEQERAQKLAGLGGELATTQAGAGIEADVAAGTRGLETTRLAGLGGLYGMNQQQAQSLASNILQRLQTGAAITAEDMNVLTQLSKQPGFWSNLMKGLGSVAGIAGSFLVPGAGGGTGDVSGGKDIYDSGKGY